MENPYIIPTSEISFEGFNNAELEKKFDADRLRPTVSGYVEVPTNRKASIIVNLDLDTDSSIPVWITVSGRGLQSYK